MEEITEGVNNMNLAVDANKKNRIQVSNTKKPLFFYVNLAKVSFFFFNLFLDLFYCLWMLRNRMKRNRSNSWHFWL